MKYKQPRSPIETRTAPPIPFETKSGAIEMRCPFCQDHHPILPNQESPCGTKIEVTCVQEYYPARTVHRENLVCVKCFQSGGEMVRYKSSFIHTINCAPESVLLQEPPVNNRWAEFVYKLDPRIKKAVEKVTGLRADQVLEIDQSGKKTGVVLAHLFWRTSGKRSAAQSR